MDKTTKKSGSDLKVE